MEVVLVDESTGDVCEFGEYSLDEIEDLVNLVSEHGIFIVDSKYNMLGSQFYIDKRGESHFEIIMREE